MKHITLTTLMILTGVILLMAVGCERKVTGNVDFPDNSSVGCFTCHSDSDVALRVARIQYDNSVHATGNNTDHNRLTSASNQVCERCHSHQGFIAQITGVPATGDAFTKMECFTCHAPHTNGDLGLRTTTAVTLLNGATFDREGANLCVTCHHSRKDVMAYVDSIVVNAKNLSSGFGPHHGPQGDMLIGENAYEYTGYTYTNSWHSTGVTEGCISCHMSNSRHESIGGHSVTMVNEVEGYENIIGCNQTGCHDTAPLTALNRPASDDFDWDGTVEGVQDEIEGLVDSLHVLLEDANLVDSTGRPISRTVATNDSAGAVYNFKFIEEDRSEGIHNTSYSVGLLQSSINFILTGDPNGVSSNKFTMLNSH